MYVFLVYVVGTWYVSYVLRTCILLSCVCLFFLIFIYVFIYFWLHWVFVAAHGLSLVVASRGYSLVAENGHLIVVASLVLERGLRCSAA